MTSSLTDDVTNDIFEMNFETGDVQLKIPLVNLAGKTYQVKLKEFVIFGTFVISVNYVTFLTTPSYLIKPREV